MKMKYEITEGVDRYRKKYSGYKMKTGPSGRRYRTADEVTTPNGNFYGRVFYEWTSTQTADWGDGLETKTHTNETVLAQIAPSTDRELIERRTKAVFEALLAVEQPERPEPALTVS